MVIYITFTGNNQDRELVERYYKVFKVERC
jgi:hypothetical protein